MLKGPVAEPEASSVQLAALAEEDLSMRRTQAQSASLPRGNEVALFHRQNGLDSLGLAPSRVYWTEQLAGLPPAVQLPLSKELSPKSRFVVYQRRVDGLVWRLISERAKRRNLSPLAVLLACYAEVLSTWSVEPDITIALASFNSEEVNPPLEQVVSDSLFLWTYRPLAGQSWGDAVRRIEEQLRLRSKEKVPPAWVLEKIATNSGLSGPGLPVTPLNAAAVINEVPGNEPLAPFTACLWAITAAPQLWFNSSLVQEEGGGVYLSWGVDEGLFTDGVPGAIFEAFHHLLEWAASTDWSEPVCELLPMAQRVARTRVNTTQGPEPGRLLHEGFLAQVKRSPERKALIWGAGKEMTYRELGDKASRIAGLLVAQGIGPGELVAVTLPKGPEQIAAVLGVLWAGAAYVPIGINQPMLRRRRICAKAQVRAVLGSEAEHLEGWPPEVKVLNLAQAAKASPLATPSQVPLESTAYIIFTSGSTGEPKGVEMSHRAAVNTIEDINVRFGVTESDRVLAVSALDFDLSVYDIFGLLSVGGAVVLLEDESRREARSWLDLIHCHGVSVWNSAPALLDMLLVVTEKEIPLSLRLVFVSGDWVGLDLPGRVKSRWPLARFIALGGATEAAIWSNSFEVTQVEPAWRSIPYGYPLRNQCFRVVNARGRDCPDWVSGELWIGGVGLARGYRGDPEITRCQFVEANGERWYRTGDLGRYWPGGRLEFLGRVDAQMKVRGFRVEPGEIEAVLQEYPAVEDAIVVLRADKWGDKRLVAYVAGNTSRLNAGELRELLKAKLPDYMLPSAIVALKKFPLNFNGKIDRRALPEPIIAKSGKNFVGPRDSFEAQLAAIWESALGIEPISVTDNFFEIGGDSLLALRIFIEIERTLGKTFPLAVLFRAPTIEKLALALREQGWKPTFSPIVAIQPHGSRPAFFCVHGGFGGVLFYGELARCLGPEQPLYALQAEGLDGGPIKHTTIESIAAYYIEEMRGIQPHGPYFFGGYSFGGFVAFEMAQQLHLAGEEVALVVLFDTRNRAGRNTLTERMRLRLQSAAFSSRRQKLKFVARRAWGKLGTTLVKWHRDIPQLFGKAKELGAEASSTQLRALDVVQTTNKQTLSAYELQLYPGAITLFRVTDPACLYDYREDYGWGLFARGGIQIHHVPGQHSTLFSQPNVRTLAKKLDECLRAATAEKALASLDASGSARDDALVP